MAPLVEGRPLAVVLKVDPQDFPALVVGCLEVMRSTDLDYRMPAVEFLRPSEGVVPLSGADRLVAAGVVAEWLKARGIPVEARGSAVAMAEIPRSPGIAARCLSMLSGLVDDSKYERLRAAARVLPGKGGLGWLREWLRDFSPLALYEVSRGVHTYIDSLPDGALPDVLVLDKAIEHLAEAQGALPQLHNLPRRGDESFDDAFRRTIREDPNVPSEHAGTVADTILVDMPTALIRARIYREISATVQEARDPAAPLGVFRRRALVERLEAQEAFLRSKAFPRTEFYRVVQDSAARALAAAKLVVEEAPPLGTLARRPPLGTVPVALRLVLPAPHFGGVGQGVKGLAYDRYSGEEFILKVSAGFGSLEHDIYELKRFFGFGNVPESYYIPDLDEAFPGQPWQSVFPQGAPAGVVAQRLFQGTRGYHPPIYASEASDDYIRSVAEDLVFTKFIGDIDRHEDNYLIRGDTLVAIDHGFAEPFTSGDVSYAFGVTDPWRDLLRLFSGDPLMYRDLLRRALDEAYLTAIRISGATHPDALDALDTFENLLSRDTYGFASVLVERQRNLLPATEGYLRAVRTTMGIDWEPPSASARRRVDLEVEIPGFGRRELREASPGELERFQAANVGGYAAKVFFMDDDQGKLWLFKHGGPVDFNFDLGEHAANTLARILGLPSPRSVVVEYGGERGILQEWLEGAVKVRLTPRDAADKLLDTPEKFEAGLRNVLVSYVVGDVDRHEDNILMYQGKALGIDYGGAFWDFYPFTDTLIDHATTSEQVIGLPTMVAAIKRMPEEDAAKVLEEVIPDLIQELAGIDADGLVDSLPGFLTEWARRQLAISGRVHPSAADVQEKALELRASVTARVENLPEDLDELYGLFTSRDVLAPIEKAIGRPVVFRRFHAGEDYSEGGARTVRRGAIPPSDRLEEVQGPGEIRGGRFDKHLLIDPATGARYMFKPRPGPDRQLIKHDVISPEAEAVAYQFAVRVGIYSPPVRVGRPTGFEGEEGSIHELIPDLDQRQRDNADDDFLTELTELAESEPDVYDGLMRDFFQQNLLDYMVGNTDGHAGNFIYPLGGPRLRVVGIDKGRALTGLLGQPGRVARLAGFQYAGPLYEEVWEAYMRGSYGGKVLPRVDMADALAPFVARIEALSDEDLDDIFYPAITAALDWDVYDGRQIETIHERMQERRNNLRADINERIQFSNPGGPLLPPRGTVAAFEVRGGRTGEVRPFRAIHAVQPRNLKRLDDPGLSGNFQKVLVRDEVSGKRFLAKPESWGPVVVDVEATNVTARLLAAAGIQAPRARVVELPQEVLPRQDPKFERVRNAEGDYISKRRGGEPVALQEFLEGSRHASAPEGYDRHLGLATIEEAYLDEDGPNLFTPVGEVELDDAGYPLWAVEDPVELDTEDYRGLFHFFEVDLDDGVDEYTDIAVNSIVDSFLGNGDINPGNLVQDRWGRLVGVDKTLAFERTEQTLDKTGVYRLFWDAHRHGVVKIHYPERLRAVLEELRDLTDEDFRAIVAERAVANADSELDRINQALGPAGARRAVPSEEYERLVRKWSDTLVRDYKERQRFTLRHANHMLREVPGFEPIDLTPRPALMIGRGRGYSPSYTLSDLAPLRQRRAVEAMVEEARGVVDAAIHDFGIARYDPLLGTDVPVGTRWSGKVLVGKMQENLLGAKYFDCTIVISQFAADYPETGVLTMLHEMLHGYSQHAVDGPRSRTGDGVAYSASDDYAQAPALEEALVESVTRVLGPRYIEKLDEQGHIARYDQLLGSPSADDDFGTKDMLLEELDRRDDMDIGLDGHAYNGHIADLRRIRDLKRTASVRPGYRARPVFPEEFEFPLLFTMGLSDRRDFLVRWINTYGTPDTDEFVRAQEALKRLVPTGIPVSRGGPARAAYEAKRPKDFPDDKVEDGADWPPLSPRVQGNIERAHREKVRDAQAIEILKDSAEQLRFLVREQTTESSAEIRRLIDSDEVVAALVAGSVREALEKAQAQVTDELIEATIDAYRADMVRLMRNARVNIRIDSRVFPEALERELADFRVKSQFETRSSMGLYSPGHRAFVENEMFGYDGDLPVEWRPVYGYLGDDRVDNDDAESMGSGPYVQDYGRFRLILKPEVNARTTFTLGDSLDEPHGAPGRVSGPSGHTVLYRDLDFLIAELEDERVDVGDLADISFDVVGPSMDDVTEPGDSRIPYVEAQVHGKVRLRDIETVVYYASYVRDPLYEPVLERIRELLSAHGIQLEVVGGD